MYVSREARNGSRKPVLFMRAQPLHNGHLNLIRCVAEKYDLPARLILDRRSGEHRDPFPFNVRKAWIEYITDELKIPIEIQKPPPYQILGLSSEHQADRRKYYFKGIDHLGIDVISGNASVKTFFSNTKNVSSMGFHDLKFIHADAIGGVDYYGFAKYRPEVCGTFIRACIYRGAFHEIAAYVPPIVLEHIALEASQHPLTNA